MIGDQAGLHYRSHSPRKASKQTINDKSGPTAKLQTITDKHSINHQAGKRKRSTIAGRELQNNT